MKFHCLNSINHRQISYFIYYPCTYGAGPALKQIVSSLETIGFAVRNYSFIALKL